MSTLPFADLFSKNGLSLERLQVLAAIAEAGSISKAAESEPVKQGQYSRQLGELSDFFGTEILVRDGRGSKLSVFGRKLAEQARLQLALLDDLRSEACEQRQLFTIAGPDALLQWVLIPRLAKICSSPFSFKLRDLVTFDAHNALTEKTADFAIVRRDDVPKHLKAVVFGKMEFCLGSTAAFPSVQEAFQAKPLAFTVGDGQIPALLKKLCAKYKISPRVPLQCQSFGQVRAAIATGCYTGFGPVAAFDGFHTLRDEMFEPLTRTIVLVWNPNAVKKRPALEKALEALKKIAVP